MRLTKHIAVVLAFTWALTTSSAGASHSLASMLVQRSDLKPAYRQVAAGYTRSPLKQNGDPIIPRQLSSNGFVIAYRAQFDNPGSHPQPMITVSRFMEGADQFRGVAGAHWGYLQEIGGTYVEAKRISMPRIGNESTWFSSFLSEPPPYEIAVMFRQGDYVVRLVLDKQAYSRNAVLQLARLVDRRIVQNG